MGLFRKPKPVQALNPHSNGSGDAGNGKKIMLNFRGRTADLARDIAAATLESGGLVAPAPEPKDPEVGDRMPDGTVYAGISPDSGEPMYTTPADALRTMKWKEATDYAAKLDVHGHKDWRLPTKGELNVMFANRAAIGGFIVSGSNPAGWYWSGTQCTDWPGAWGQRFINGFQVNYFKDGPSSVRCVR